MPQYTRLLGRKVVLVSAVLIFGAVVGGVVMSTGAVSLLDDQESIPTATPAPSVSPTPTETPDRSPTAISPTTEPPTTSEGELREEYSHVRREYLERWSELPQDHPTIPELLGTEVRMDQDALWVVFDETDVFENASRMRDEWTSVANGYLHALYNHRGPAPDRMIAVGWNNTGPITHFRVETDDARARLHRNISYNTFYNRFFRTVRATNDAERSIAREIAEHPPDDN